MPEDTEDIISPKSTMCVAVHTHTHTHTHTHMHTNTHTHTHTRMHTNTHTHMHTNTHTHTHTHACVCVLLASCGPPLTMWKVTIHPSTHLAAPTLANLQMFLSTWLLVDFTAIPEKCLVAKRF
jgi:hypothetical protein